MTKQYWYYNIKTKERTNVKHKGCRCVLHQAGKLWCWTIHYRQAGLLNNCWYRNRTLALQELLVTLAYLKSGHEWLEIVVVRSAK